MGRRHHLWPLLRCPRLGDDGAGRRGCTPHFRGDWGDWVAGCIYGDRRRPGGLPPQATVLLLADVVGATVCRRDGGGPRRYNQRKSGAHPDGDGARQWLREAPTLGMESANLSLLEKYTHIK